ncbi:MAG: hypothetical protein DHS20C17_03910 [Cyclobacteriaceae bacterium]|nr:MAG: hypothetical protein DHS20C17_03910 [Cyclobacteriaceae bacterium]
MKTIEFKDSTGNTFAFVRKDHDKPWIYIQWVGVLKVDEIKKVMTQNINFLKEINCQYVLSDRSKSEGNLFELSHFIEHKWASSAVEAGLRGVANVTAPSAPSAFTSQDLASRVLGFEFKSFGSLEEAEAWLIECSSMARH